MDLKAAPSSRELERAARHVHPGEWAVEDGRPIATLLGSCVSVCLYEPRLRFGGMNHFMLPAALRDTGSEYDALLHGDYAMEVLLNAMLERGAHKARIVAKAFGGGNVVGSLRRSIGEGNILFARSWLARENVTLTSSDFGGPWSRKVILNPVTGDAYCKRVLGSQAIDTEVAKQEAAYETRLAKPVPPAAPSIELF